LVCTSKPAYSNQHTNFDFFGLARRCIALENLAWVFTAGSSEYSNLLFPSNPKNQKSTGAGKSQDYKISQKEASSHPERLLPPSSSFHITGHTLFTPCLTDGDLRLPTDLLEITAIQPPLTPFLFPTYRMVLPARI
jgi:hypothetical protein